MKKFIDTHGPCLFYPILLLAVTFFLGLKCYSEEKGEAEAAIGKANLYAIVFVDNRLSEKELVDILAIIDEKSSNKSIVYKNVFEPSNRQVRVDQGFMVAVEIKSAGKLYALMLEKIRSK